jgi:excisionase family DNA binding protein
MVTQLELGQAGDERLWTIKDVAVYLRLKPDTVRAMVRRGELPGFKLGKRLWRFDVGKIETWLNEHDQK